MVKFIHPRHTIGVRNALNGVIHVVRTQPNFKIHLAAALIALFLGYLLEISPLEWSILTFTIFWVLISEMINTSIEAMVDLISKNYSQEAKVAKDVAAGMVLVGAVGSIIVGLVIFLPKISSYWTL